jgi:tRNA A-37 threonylcarbamoyl transferase component Bud32
VSALDVLSRLPPTFEVRESNSGVLALRRDAAKALERAGFGLESDGATESARLSGRAPLSVLRAGNEEFVLRRFTHGGLLRWITGARFLDAERPFRELLLSEELARRGIPSPQVVAARAVRRASGGWGLALVTRRVHGAIDGGELLLRASRGELGPRRRRALYSALGAFVARLHSQGFLHADLHPKNLLVSEFEFATAAPVVWVLDLDRSVWRNALDGDARRANLRRFFRYVWRRKERGEYRVEVTDVARFLCGYEGERAARHALWRAVATAHARTRGLHRLGWALEGGAPRPQ